MKIVFAGTPDFAAQHLTGLIDAGLSISAVVTQPDKPGKRGKKLVPCAVKQAAESHGLEVLQPKKVSAADLSPFSPDLLIVVAYGQLLREDVLALPTHGCINVHGSLLPRWRGAAPIQRAIEAGDKTTGVCIMQMDPGLDTGPVLLRREITIDANDTAGVLSDKLAQAGIVGLLNIIDQVESNTLDPEVQPEEGTYAKKISKHEARINWKESAANIVNKIHAFNPDPICFTMCPVPDGEIRLKLYNCEAIDKAHTKTPGQIIDVSTEGVTVVAGSGLVRVSRLQLPLGKGSILTGRDIQNSRTDILFPGVRLY